jgi:RES domain
VTPVDAGRLPRKTLKAGTPLYRIHRAVHGPWFFDDGPLGRFNPTGSPGRGACYFAEQPLGAWVESFRTTMVLAEADVAARALTAVTLDRDVVVRDLTVRRALKAGVTTALTAGGDYRDSQALADALQGRADGVRWRVRHDLAQQLKGIAWFGPAGPADDALRTTLPPAVTEPIPRDLVADAERRFGYSVLPTP